MESDFQKTSFIRRKVAEIVDIGIGTNNIEKEQFWNFSGERFYNIFLFDSSSVYCGETAFFLKNVYKDLGYNSTTYDMGDKTNKATHQLNLVFLNDENMWCIQDAYFNITITDTNNSPINFFDLIKILSINKNNLIKVKQDTYQECPDRLLKHDVYLAFVPLINHFSWAKIYDKKLFKGKVFNKVTSCRYYDEFISNKNINSRYFSALDINQLPKNFIYLYLLPLNHNEGWILDSIEKIKNHI